MLFCGVDIGTFETKGVIVDDVGRIVARAARADGIKTPRAGQVEHDAEVDWWQGFVDVVRDLLASPEVDGSRIACVGCSGIGPCVLAVDRDWKPLYAAILYGVDTAASAEIAALNRVLGEEEIFARAGNRLTSQSAGPKIVWLQRHEPEVHSRAAYFVTCQSFIVGRLTGVPTIDHATASYFHPIYDLYGQCWDVAGCEDFAELGKLPTVAWSTDVAGTVTRDAAAVTGLRVGLPVIVGTADAPAEAMAGGVVSPGHRMVMYGSSSFMIQLVERPVSSRVLWAAPYTFPGSFSLAAGTSTAGTLTHWIAALLGLDGSTAEAVFSELVELGAGSPPGAGGF